VAVALAGVAAAALGIIVPVSISGVQAGAQLSTATFLAEQALERARGAAWTADPPVDCLGLSSSDLAPGPVGATCHTAVMSEFPDGGAIDEHPQYRRTVRIESCVTTPCAGVISPGLRLVEVSVAYTPLTGAGSVSASPGTVRLAWLVSQK